jgi:FKBP-type peptidyl-prolyl cis-trans isomerase FklB
MPTSKNPTGFLFDSSYEGELEPDFDVPVTMILSGTVTGFSTALQHMVSGDFWRIYIPATLGYGFSDFNGIPGGSVLVFDVNMVSFESEGI